MVDTNPDESVSIMYKNQSAEEKHMEIIKQHHMEMIREELFSTLKDINEERINKNNKWWKF